MTSFIDPPRLPTLDLSLFDVGDPWRDHVAAQVDWASSTFGLFHIVGHGVDAGLIDTLLELSRKFIVQEESDQSRVRGDGGLADLPGFRDAVQEYTTAMTGLGHKLMTTMARGLRLHDSYFVDRYTGNPATLLRILDYPIALPPAVSQRDSGQSTDRGLLTIVKPGEGSGQQVRFDGRWIDVPAVAGALLCYVGPVLERLTNGRYVSPVHRLSSGRAGERLSLSFFFEPEVDAELEPIAEFARDPVRVQPVEGWGGPAPGASLSRLGAPNVVVSDLRYVFAARC